jgi:hypothetical protein
MSVLKVGRAATLAGLFANTAWLCFLSPLNVAMFSRFLQEYELISKAAESIHITSAKSWSKLFDRNFFANRAPFY